MKMVSKYHIPKVLNMVGSESRNLHAGDQSQEQIIPKTRDFSLRSKLQSAFEMTKDV